MNCTVIVVPIQTVITEGQVGGVTYKWNSYTHGFGGCTFGTVEEAEAYGKHARSGQRGLVDVG